MQCFSDATCFASPVFPYSSFYSQTLLITGKHGNDVVVRNAHNFRPQAGKLIPSFPRWNYYSHCERLLNASLFAGNCNIKLDALERLQFFPSLLSLEIQRILHPHCVRRARFVQPKFPIDNGEKKDKFFIVRECVEKSLLKFEKFQMSWEKFIFIVLSSPTHQLKIAFLCKLKYI